MVIKNSEVLFLIRSYNEATRITETLRSIIEANYREILVIDDGSIDDTQMILQTQFPGMLYSIRHSLNCGAGAALETGFEFVRRYSGRNRWKYVVTFDADGQHDIRNISRFITAFSQDPTLDIVFGSRFIEKTQTNVPFLRYMILYGGKIFTSLISHVKLTDAHNGYRMMRTAVLSQIHLTMNGMEYASEFIDQVGKHHFHFTEVPVDITYDEYTLKKGQRLGGPWRVMTRMIWKKFF